MKNFIFYTTEGYTLSPDQTELENCQILAFVSAIDMQKAWCIFTTQYTDVFTMGFSIGNIVCAELIFV